MIDIITIRWGDKFGPEYVRKLYDAVRRHLTIPYRFICFTDDVGNPELSDIYSISLDEGLEGWWNKMVIYDPFHTKHMADKRIWIDLDTVIVDNIDFLAEYDGDLAMLDDFYFNKREAAGLLVFNGPACGYIWEAFNGVRPTYIKMGSDGTATAHIAHTAGKPPDRIQKIWPSKVVSYKVHCKEGVPRGTSIVCFHGQPRPADVSDLDWMKEHWR